MMSMSRDVQSAEVDGDPSNADMTDETLALGLPFSTRLWVLALFSVILVFVVALGLSQYSRTETVSGVLVTEQPSAKVLAPVTGVITRMMIKEGDVVRANQPLATVDVDRRNEAGQRYAASNIEKVDQQYRLAAVRIGLTATSQASERDSLADTVASANRKMADIDTQIALQTEIVNSNEMLFRQIETMVERGFVSKVEQERRRQTMLNAKQQLSALAQQRIATQQERDRAARSIGALDAETARERNEIEAMQQSLMIERSSLEAQAQYQLAAPIAGRVTAMQAAAGRVIHPDVPAMIIVPVDARLKARLYAPTRAVGFIRARQQVRLLYDAFPYQRFGSFEGRVISVSRIALDPKEIEGPLTFAEPVYQIDVEIAQQAIPTRDDATPLQPGMTLTASIILERQSFFAWLLSPLTAVINRS